MCPYYELSPRVVRNWCLLVEWLWQSVLMDALCLVSTPCLGLVSYHEWWHSWHVNTVGMLSRATQFHIIMIGNGIIPMLANVKSLWYHE